MDSLRRATRSGLSLALGLATLALPAAAKRPVMEYAGTSWTALGRVRTSGAGRATGSPIQLALSFPDATTFLVSDGDIDLSGTFAAEGMWLQKAVGELDQGSRDAFADAVEQQVAAEVGGDVSATVVEARVTGKVNAALDRIKVKTQLRLDVDASAVGRPIRIRQVATAKGSRDP
jgi:hypothetical protein